MNKNNHNMKTSIVKSSINTFLATSTIAQVQAEVAKRSKRKSELWELLEVFNNDDSVQEDEEKKALASGYAEQIISIGEWLGYVQGCYDVVTWEEIVKGVVDCE